MFPKMRATRLALILASAPAVCSLSGCLVVGYSSGGGWWVWPGSLIVTLVFVVVWLLTRR